MDNTSIDVQCKQILDGIINLEDLLQDPLAKEALALSDNIDTNRNKDLLTRLKKSLIQYVERGKDLFYVGLMGHFSTGKSSSINSLLSLDEDSDKARRVGLNPVDKLITLITHSENKDTVFNSTKGGMVSITLEFIDHDFLKNIVLADTPGVGDPVLASKLTKDFLPICDLIVYFFSATNPFDSTDVPLLEEKQSELPFIPIKFVVTRADEFRRDRNSPLDKSNFDRFKGENFVETLSYRLNGLVNYEQSFVGAEHIVLVDNKSQFNIPELKQIISEIADISKTQTKISLHSHKVEYFRSSAEELREFFGKFIANKLATISDIVKIAENNVVRFQNTIQVVNNGLTTFWSEKLRAIDFKRISTQKDVCKPHVLPASLHKASQDILRYDDLRRRIIKQAEKRNAEIRASLTKDVKSCLTSDLLDLSQKIDNISFEGSSDLSQVEFEVSHFRAKNVIEKLVQEIINYAT